jgi:hypothetical protein
MPPLTKRQRFSLLGRGAHVTKSAVASILRELYEQGEIGEAASRSTISRSRRVAADLSTPYGNVLDYTTVSDGEHTQRFAMLNPIPLLWYLVSVCGPFATYLATVLEHRPATPANPWRVALYADEVTPGNSQAYDNSRKIYATYWSFFELGGGANSNEDMWFTTHAARSVNLKKISGGVSLLFVDWINRFCDRDRHTFASGVSLPFPDGPKVIVAKVDIIIADGDALKAAFCVKGAGGSKPCMECKNVTLHSLYLGDAGARYRSADGREMRIVSHTCTDERQMDLHTDHSMMEWAAKLARSHGVINAAQFEQMEIQLGINYVPGGLLFTNTLEARLRPIHMLMHDWAHIFLVNGLYNITLGVLMHALHPRVTYQHLHEFLQRWTWPSRLSSRAADARDVCKPSRAHSHWEAWSFKAGASECLSTYPIIRKYMEFVVAPDVAGNGKLPAAVQSYLDVCYALDLCQLSTREVVTADNLQTSICAYLDGFKIAFGEDCMLPKHHWAIHLPNQLRRRGRLLHCLVHERNHKHIKKWANDDSNSKSTYYESTILTEILHDTLHDLKQEAKMPPVQECLIGPRPAIQSLVEVLRNEFPTVREFECAKSAWFSATQKCHVGDVCLVDLGGDQLRVAELLHLVTLDGVCAALVSVWESRGDDLYYPADNVRVCELGWLRETLIYKVDAVRHAVEILPPMHVR